MRIETLLVVLFNLSMRLKNLGGGSEKGSDSATLALLLEATKASLQPAPLQRTVKSVHSSTRTVLNLLALLRTAQFFYLAVAQ